MIVATDANGCIGYNNDLVFKSKKDLKRFKELTSDNIVVMGSKTYESIGSKPLPNRINVVLSNKLMEGRGVLVYNDIEYMLEELEENYPDKIIWIIGGANVYKQFIGNYDYIYLTKFHGTADKCDTKIDINDFIGDTFVVKNLEDHNENDQSFTFIDYINTKKYFGDRLIEYNKKAIADNKQILEEISLDNLIKDIDVYNSSSKEGKEHLSNIYFEKGKKLYLEVQVNDSYTSSALMAWLYNKSKYDNNNLSILGCNLLSIGFEKPSGYTAEEKHAVKMLYEKMFGSN